MPGLGPGIHVFLSLLKKAWMAGTSPDMTVFVALELCAPLA